MGRRITLAVLYGAIFLWGLALARAASSELETPQGLTDVSGVASTPQGKIRSLTDTP